MVDFRSNQRSPLLQALLSSQQQGPRASYGVWDSLGQVANQISPMLISALMQKKEAAAEQEEKAKQQATQQAFIDSILPNQSSMGMQGPEDPKVEQSRAMIGALMGMSPELGAQVGLQMAGIGQKEKDRKFVNVPGVGLVEVPTQAGGKPEVLIDAPEKPASAPTTRKRIENQEVIVEEWDAEREDWVEQSRGPRSIRQEIEQGPPGSFDIDKVSRRRREATLLGSVKAVRTIKNILDGLESSAKGKEAMVGIPQQLVRGIATLSNAAKGISRLAQGTDKPMAYVIENGQQKLVPEEELFNPKRYELGEGLEQQIAQNAVTRSQVISLAHFLARTANEEGRLSNFDVETQLQRLNSMDAIGFEAVLRDELKTIGQGILDQETVAGDPQFTAQIDKFRDLLSGADAAPSSAPQMTTEQAMQKAQQLGAEGLAELKLKNPAEYERLRQMLGIQ